MSKPGLVVRKLIKQNVDKIFALLVETFLIVDKKTKIQ